MSLLDLFNFKKKDMQLSELRICNSRLEETITQLNQEISKSHSEIASLNSEIAALHSKLSTIESFIHQRVPCFDINLATSASTLEERRSLWTSAWQHINHNDEHQLRRQNRACNACITPLKINSEDNTAIFRGTNTDYVTSLTHCTCTDFQRHLQPCKHMYRLAYEFNVHTLDNVDYVSEPAKIFLRTKLESILATLTSGRLETFHYIAYDGIRAVRRTDAAPLIELGLIEICTDKFVLLNSYTRDELLALLPQDGSIKRNSRKSDLIEYIISSCPDIITELEKLKVPVRLTPYVLHLKKYIY